MRYLPVITALALFGAYGVAEGLWTHRWSSSNEVEEAVERLKGVPQNFGTGAWKGGENLKLRDVQVKRAEMAGYLCRNYVNVKTDQVLQVLLVCGPPGPTSLHAPEVCFLGAGYVLTAPTEHLDVKTDAREPHAQFWVGNFQKTGALREKLRSAWAWSATGKWQAPKNPRFDFAMDGALYKLYVNHELTGPEEQGKDPIADFLKEFLPELDKHLFPANAPREGKS